MTVRELLETLRDVEAVEGFRAKSSPETEQTNTACHFIMIQNMICLV